LDQTPPGLTASLDHTVWKRLLASIQHQAITCTIFLASCDSVGEQKCQAILDLDTTEEDMEVHHHSSTLPSQTTTRRTRGTCVFGLNADICIDLTITDLLNHKADMATNSRPRRSNRTATLR